MGLQEACISCHEDYHQATLGTECRSCHNTTSFKPASLFNHNDAEFKLTGAHIKLNCSKCHPAENRDGKVHIKFKGIKFRNCTSCHKDIHLGKFGIECKKCHSTDGFKKIMAAEFNHSLTGFPLTGKHNKVECSNCHKEGMKVKLKYDRCSDCHEDFHKGEFTSVNNSTDCIKCHNTDGFKPSLFSTESHTYTNFVLAGKHLAVSCRECHHNGNELKFKFADLSCVTCHANIHQDEITEKYLGNNNCKNCHNENSWHDISFDHTATGFILEGKHESVSCNACHDNKAGISIKYIFKSVKTGCESCHADIHAGQFKVTGHTDCSKCHQADGWKKSTFDHSKTSFPLTGAHKSVECGKCHKSVVASNNDHYMVYKIGKSKCTDCHQ